MANRRPASNRLRKCTMAISVCCNFRNGTWTCIADDRWPVALVRVKYISERETYRFPIKYLRGLPTHNPRHRTGRPLGLGLQFRKKTRIENCIRNGSIQCYFWRILCESRMEYIGPSNVISWICNLSDIHTTFTLRTYSLTYIRTPTLHKLS